MSNDKLLMAAGITIATIGIAGIVAICYGIVPVVAHVSKMH